MNACNPRSGEAETDAWALLSGQLLYSSFPRAETFKDGGQAHETWKEEAEEERGGETRRMRRRKE